MIIHHLAPHRAVSRIQKSLVYSSPLCFISSASAQEANAGLGGHRGDHRVATGDLPEHRRLPRSEIIDSSLGLPHESGQLPILPGQSVDLVSHQVSGLHGRVQMVARGPRAGFGQSITTTIFWGSF